MKRKDGELHRISWDEALDTIGGKLKEIKEKYGAHSLAVWTGSVGVENIDVSYLLQRFRGAFGSPNFLCVESICYRARIMARQMTFGRYPVEEPEKSNCIVLWGHNPTESNWTMARDIDHQLKKGAKLIVIDPRRIPLAKKGLHLQPRLGTDCALALAMINVIISEELYDAEFVEKWTVGFDKLKEHVKSYTPEKAEEISGVPATDIRRVARIYATTKHACIAQGTGSLDQQVTGFQNSRVFGILQAITGNIDVPGGWATTPLLPTTDMRVPVDEVPIGADKYPLFYTFWNKVSPYGQGMELSDTILTEKPYPIKALIVAGGNPMLTMPENKKFRQALEKLELLVVIDPFWSDTAEVADVVLPACTFLEKTTIGGYPYGLMHGTAYVILRKKVIEPLDEAWPDTKIFCELGRSMGLGEYFPWQSEEEIVDYFLKTSPVTLKDLQKNPSGMFFGRKDYGFYEKIGFATPSKKIELYSETLEKAGYDPLPAHREPSQSPISSPELAREYPLMLTTGARILHYIHTQLRSMPEMRSQFPEPIVEINPATAQKYGIADGELVVLETVKGSVKVKARVTEDIMQQTVSIAHGWSQASADVVTGLEGRDPVTGYPELRALLCRIKKAY
jgi:anaerobic selenocysteine-containing dehydrogenase